MVSRENTVIAVCGVVALVLTYLGHTLTGLGDTALLAVLLTVGVVVPQTLNTYLDRRANA